MPTPTEWFALTTVALFLKMFAVALLQGLVRARTERFTRKADAEAYGDGEVADTKEPIVDRAQRTLRNDVENIPIFLFLAWSFVTLEAWPAAAPVYFGGFVASRLFHTFAYLRSWQPTRTIVYMVGIAVDVALCIHIVLAVV